MTSGQQEPDFDAVDCVEMTSGQQEPDFDAVKRAESAFPDAKSFCCKPEIPAVHIKADDTLRLTNGAASTEEAPGDGSSEGSPMSASPPASSGEESQGLELNLAMAADTGASHQQDDDAGCHHTQQLGQTQGDPPTTDIEATKTEKSVAFSEQPDVASAAPAKGADGGDEGASTSSKDVVSAPQSAIKNGLGVDDMGDAEQGAKSSTPTEETDRLSAASPELRKLLLRQLEYYFSRVNLEQDHYLQSQMDGDQYVSIATIANFNQVVKLTRDYDLIVDVLKSSSQVQVDNTGTKVRPKYNRSVLMLREIPQDTPKSEVEAIFKHEKCPAVVSCEFAHNGYWYIRFKTDKDAIEAYLFLREHEIKFKDKPVMARIKANSLVRSVGMSSQFCPGPSSGCDHLHLSQQNGVMPFITAGQQSIPNQFPVMGGHLPQFLGQQQVQQILPPVQAFVRILDWQQLHLQQFQIYHLPPLLPQWSAGNTDQHFLDPLATILPMDGYQAAGMKSACPNRNVFSTFRNRGVGRHNRTQSVGLDRSSNYRPMDRAMTQNSSSGAHPIHGSNGQATPDVRDPILIAGSGPSHREGPAASCPSGGSPISPAVVAPTIRSIPVSHTRLHGSKTESVVIVPSHPRRGGYRRSRRFDDGSCRNEEGSRRIDEGSRNARSNPVTISKDTHFLLQATSFPPLPGSSKKSACVEATEGSCLSDIVKGVTPFHSNNEADRVKTITTRSATATPVSAPVSTAVSRCLTTTANTGSSTTSGIMSPVVGSRKNGGNKPAIATGASPTAEPACDKNTTTVESRPSVKSSVALGQAAPLVASKPMSEAQLACANSTTVSSSTAQVKSTDAPASLSTVESIQTASAPAPIKLSYAQMVARKQAESAVKVKVSKDGGDASPEATPAVPDTAPGSQSQLASAASATVSASVTKSASGRPSLKEQTRKDSDFKEFRFQGGKRTRDYRDPRDYHDQRQPRFEPR